jgi:hypothetical protein
VATDRKPYCRIETSLYREAWPGDLKLALVNLVMLMCDRWARDRLTTEQAIQVVLSKAQVAEVSGKHRTDVASKLLQRLADVASISIERQGDFTAIRWPKLAETQGWASRDRANSARKRPRSAPAPAPAPAKDKSGPLARPKSAKSTPRNPEPWSLHLSRILQELLADVPGARLPAGCERRWAREIERLAQEVPELRALTPDDRDKRIEFAIRWALDPATNLGQEFEVVIRSGRGLREKWPKLVAGAQRKGRKVSEVNGFMDFVMGGDAEVAG